MKKQTIELELPKLSKETFVTTYAQFRPYRQGGLRIEHQRIQQKDFYHNYGHGGAGWSLSYGSVRLCLKQFHLISKVHNQTKCAIIGSGVMGLLTAVELAKLGYKPTIYSQKIPLAGEKDNSKCITSQVAPGLWLPYGYDNHDQKRHNLISKQTFDYFSECINRKKYMKSLSFCRVYDRVLPLEILEQVVPKDVCEYQNRKVDIKFQNGYVEEYTYFETIRINSQYFLDELIEELKQLNVQICEMRFNQIKEVLCLQQKYIFNCSGLGSRELFGDKKCVGIKGHLIEFKNTNPLKYNYFIRNKLNLTQDDTKTIHELVYIYCHEQRIIVGLTRQQDSENCEVNPLIRDKMIKAVHRFMQERTVSNPNGYDHHIRPKF